MITYKFNKQLYYYFALTELGLYWICAETSSATPIKVVENFCKVNKNEIQKASNTLSI